MATIENESQIIPELVSSVKSPEANPVTSTSSVDQDKPLVCIQRKAIVIKDRSRTEFGNIDGLANSIKENGLIQPIVISRTSPPVLVAGERRMRALERLGVHALIHAKHFIWRDEEDDYRRKSAELEENLQRKEMTWQEQVRGKAELFRLQQSIHGEQVLGAPTRSEKRDGSGTAGFGVRKLAALLGENVSITSQDLQLAKAMELMPSLAKADTKEGARRKINTMGSIVSMLNRAKPSTSSSDVNVLQPDWKLYEGEYRKSIGLIPDEAADLIYTDLPFGVSLSQMSKHGSGLVTYRDDRTEIVDGLQELTRQAFRVLHNDRFAVFFFGFNYYTELQTALKLAGFSVNPVPVVWYKHSRSTENPNTRYANAYDPAIVAMKGSPVFIRPGQANVLDIAPVLPSNKLQIAQQPVELVDRFIKDMVVPGATILDFMAGSGTTGEAVLKNKCKAILFERDPEACLVIKARLGAFKP